MADEGDGAILADDIREGPRWEWKELRRAYASGAREEASDCFASDLVGWDAFLGGGGGAGHRTWARKERTS